MEQDDDGEQLALLTPRAAVRAPPGSPARTQPPRTCRSRWCRSTPAWPTSTALRVHRAHVDGRDGACRACGSRCASPGRTSTASSSSAGPTPSTSGGSARCAGSSRPSRCSPRRSSPRPARSPTGMRRLARRRAAARRAAPARGRREGARRRAAGARRAAPRVRRRGAVRRRPGLPGPRHRGRCPAASLLALPAARRPRLAGAARRGRPGRRRGWPGRRARRARPPRRRAGRGGPRRGARAPGGTPGSPPTRGRRRATRPTSRCCAGTRRSSSGTRAAAFAPVRDLGLVAWWDDGDDLLEEPRAPYPHVREVLLARAAGRRAPRCCSGFSRSVAVADLVERRVLTAEEPREPLLRRGRALGARRR